MLDYHLFQFYSPFLLSFDQPVNNNLFVVNDSLDSFFFDNKKTIKGQIFVTSLKRINVDVQRNLQSLKIRVGNLEERKTIKQVWTYINSDIDYHLLDNLLIDNHTNNIVIVINTTLTIGNFLNSNIYKLLTEIKRKSLDKEIDLPDNIYAIFYNSSKSTLLPLVYNRDYQQLTKVFYLINKLWITHPEINKDEEEVQITTKLTSITQNQKEASEISTMLSVTSTMPPIVNRNTLQNSIKASVEKLVPDSAPVKNWYILSKDISQTIIKPEPIKLPDIGLNSFLPKTVLNTSSDRQEFVDMEYKNTDEYFKTFLETFKEELGFALTEFKRTPIKIKDNELYPSMLEKVSMKISDKYGQSHHISMLLPSVLDDGTIQINGGRYVVTKQLYTLPIIFPKIGEARFSSFTITFLITKLQTYTRIRIAGYSLPIGVLFLITTKLDDILGLYKIKGNLKDSPEKDSINIPFGEHLYLVIPGTLDTAQEDILKDIKRLKLDKIKVKSSPLTPEWQKELAVRSTGNLDAYEYLRFNINSSVDGYTKQLLITKGFPIEIRQLIKYAHEKVLEGYHTSRNDLRELRLRSYEGIIHIALDEIRQSIVRYHRAKEINKNEKAFLKVNERAVLQNLQGSGQARVLENINPFEEVSQINQITYAGYGGLPADNVPEAIRGIHPSFYGNIDPVATPEGKTLGVNQHLSLGAKISTTYGAMVPENITDNIGIQILSPVSAATPFLSKNESTRQVMTYNQALSAVPLSNPDAPLVRTGIEHIIPYLTTSKTFMEKAPCDAIVKEVKDNDVLLQCKDNNVIKITGGIRKGRSGQFISSLNVLTPCVKEGQSVQKGQPILTSSVIKHDAMSLGKNLVTTYLMWKGSTYEDGIVVSSDMNNLFKSKHQLDKELFIDIDSSINEIYIKKEYKPGDVILSANSNKLSQLINQGIIDSSEVISFMNKFSLMSEYDSKLIECKIYTTKDAFDKFRTKLLPYEKNIIIQDRIVYKRESLNGILFKISLQVEIGVGMGDKFTNRHAAKGVVTLIESEENMPKLPDGRHVQIIINPLSVINRTNTGQLYELYTGEIAYQLTKFIIDNKSDKPKVIKKLSEILSILDKSNYHQSLITFLTRANRNQWSDFIKYAEESGVPIFIPPFSEPNYKDIMNVMKIMNIPNRYKLKLPDGTIREAPVGILYIYKLEHMAFFKTNARSTGAYDVTTGQATAGKKRQGGQRIGERDIWALSSYGATNLIKEFFTIGSDDISAKRDAYVSIMNNGSASLNDALEHHVSQTKDLAYTILKGAMVDPKE